jgi:hypothetical protein
LCLVPFLDFVKPMAMFLLVSLFVCFANGEISPSQLRLTFAPNINELVVGWTSHGDNTNHVPLVESGPSASALNTTTAGTSVSFTNSYCPASNSTRTSHFAAFPARAGATTFYRVSSDSGGSWSPVLPAINPARGFPVRVALWGDLGVDCGGVLPPSPGFAGGQCTAVPQLAKDSASGAHQFSVHYGDTAYNMDDKCGVVGDAFLDAASSYSAHRPHVYTNGNHESSGSLKPYTEFTHRLAYPQTPLANASGSQSNRWMMWAVGPVTFVSLDPDAWIYPLVYPLLDEQYAWLQAAMARVDRAATPWVVFLVHRAAYCTKSTDAECNSEAEALRNGQLGVRAPLEKLLAQYGVDFYFSGHTHHYERTYPCVRGAATQKDYLQPRGTVHIQSGIAGTGPGDQFVVPAQAWEAFRDEEYYPTYGRLTLFNESHALYEQLFNDNGTVFDSFLLTNTQPSHGAPF